MTRARPLRRVRCTRRRFGRRRRQAYDRADEEVEEERKEAGVEAQDRAVVRERECRDYGDAGDDPGTDADCSRAAPCQREDQNEGAKLERVSAGCSRTCAASMSRAR